MRYSADGRVPIFVGLVLFYEINTGNNVPLVIY